ncbi:MAG: M13 family peptidase [Candidatus Koribacter versatilis]|uniref:M13 family peptidase n=1 Tax=Candidatus Korobacter versatilis TaxID=658062 RepID=A0A932A7P1_9BACT|nr:M13 family peptidase [Candidatus Koribacter versatilis]
MRQLRILLLVLVCATLASAQTQTPPATQPSSAAPMPKRMTSFDVDAMDKSAQPCQDFYQFACGGFIAKNPIPPDQTRWGRFEMLREYNRAVSRQILDKAAAKKQYADANEQKIGDYYGTCLDQSATTAKKLVPAQQYLAQINGMKSTADLAKVIGSLHKQGLGGMFAWGPAPMLHNAAMTASWADQGGMALGNKDFYTKTDEKSVRIREQYVQHVANMLHLAGAPEADAKTQAQQVMDIEMKLANAAMTPTERRDTTKLDHWTKVADLQAMTPSFTWNNYFVEVGAPKIAELNVGNPAFFTALDAAIKTVPLAQWKTYLKWHFLHGQAESLPVEFSDETFSFYGKVLGGAQQQLPLWNRCMRATDGDLGEALGKYYVDVAFGGNAKERTLKMVGDIERAMETDIKTLDWMTDETKQKALEKLHAVANKIGYPDQWRDYSTLKVVRGDRLGNSLRANTFEFNRQLKKIGGPVDKKEWGMTPPTVNAYYSPLQNNINFPAGILQPPFFDNSIDDAVNYGAIGIVIGHELTHGFDDSGARFAANGDLKNWWSPVDKAEFEKRTSCIADQYSEYSPIEGVKLQGRLTLGENAADNGGSHLAIMALRSSYANGQEPAPKDGFTAEQRFWIGFGQVWCENVRPERARTMALSDPHSPGRFRTNGVVSNSPDFQKAFGCKAGDPMVRQNACRVW